MASRTPTEHQMKSAAYIAGENRTPFPSSSTKVMAETSQCKTPKVRSSSGNQQFDDIHHQFGGLRGSVHPMQGGHDEGYVYHHPNYQPQGGLKKDCNIPAIDDRNRTTHPGTEVQQGNSAQPKYNPWSGTLSDAREKSKPFTRQVSSSVDATSPIQLRRGGLTDYPADVYVNTAHHRLNLNHGAVAKSLLRFGGPALQVECTQYITQHGSVPVWGYATTGGGNLRCKHVIHAVGTDYDRPGGSAEKGMERMLSNIMGECDRLGVSSVTFPAIGTGVLRFPDDTVAKTMLQTISTYLRTHPSTTVKQVLLVIFEEKTYKAFQSVMQTSTSVPTPSYTPRAVQQPGQSLYDRVDKSGTLSDTRERSKPFSRQVSSSVDSTSPIQLKRGGLTDHQADVYVNTAHQSLDLKHGAVAQSLLRSGGPALQAECNQYIAQHGSVPVWGYATTGGGNLRCKHIIHAVCTWYNGPGKSAEKGMERMLSNIMGECDRLGVSSVAFPAIGTGVLGFPNDTVAKTMIQTISTYLHTHPSTTVKQVLLVIFEDRTYKAFQSVMQSSTSVPTPSYTPRVVQQVDRSLYDDADMSHFEEQGGHHGFTNPPPGQHAVLQSFTRNRVTINIVHGDITEEDCDGLVSTSSPNLTLHNFGVMGALLRKGGPELQHDCTSAVRRQGNLSSSKVIVTGAGRPGGLKCKRILHVLAPTQPDSLCKIVKEVLKKANWERLGVVALPAIGTGAHGFSAEQAAEGICDAIVEFSEGSHNYVNHIKVVLFQEEMYSKFSAAFTIAGNKKGFAKKAWNKTKEVIGSISRGLPSGTFL